VEAVERAITWKTRAIIPLRLRRHPSIGRRTRHRCG
jgi:hypothetical protein